MIILIEYSNVKVYETVSPRDEQLRTTVSLQKKKKKKKHSKTQTVNNNKKFVCEINFTSGCNAWCIPTEFPYITSIAVSSNKNNDNNIQIPKHCHADGVNRDERIWILVKQQKVSEAGTVCFRLWSKFKELLLSREQMDF